MKNDLDLTTDARRHLRLFLSAVRPMAVGLERKFRSRLRERPYDDPTVRAVCAITPAAASRLRTLDQFCEQVAYNGRRLAKLNVPPAEASELLGDFGAVLEQALEGRFAPAREQLQLVTRLTLNQAYYQVREAEAQAFFGLHYAEAEARDLDDLLGRLVGILARTFHAQAGRLHLLDTPLKGKLARPLYIERGNRDEELITSPDLRGAHASYWSFPVRECALLQLGFATAYPWLPRELALLQAAGARCFEAIERAHTQRELRRLEAEARRAEETERRRIGRELHDEAAQSLAVLRLQLELMEKEAPPALRQRLLEARLTTERTVVELRRTISALSPAVVERLGLEAALRQLAARFGKQHQAEIGLAITADLKRMTTERQDVIYRVAQEALQNVFKHSQATKVKLLLNSADKNIKLSIRDNGAGFITGSSAGMSESFGLTGMQERAALLGGTLVLRSAPGKGATVVLELPWAPR
jgi:signal transduction histidine kinase